MSDRKRGTARQIQDATSRRKATELPSRAEQSSLSARRVLMSNHFPLRYPGIQIFFARTTSVPWGSEIGA